MNLEERSINGALLRLRREAQGWVVNDMALRACLSVKQIRQLEEGGTSAFYSDAVKATAAKKVGSLLGLAEHEVFVQTQESEQGSVHEPLDAHVTESAPAPIAVDEAPSTQEHADASPMTPQQSSTAETSAKPKTSLWVITALFFAALAVAAYLQPQDEQETEAAPPLQAVPDAEAAASAASAADLPVSAASAIVSVASATVPAVAASSASAAAPAASKAP